MRELRHAERMLISCAAYVPCADGIVGTLPHIPAHSAACSSLGAKSDQERRSIPPTSLHNVEYESMNIETGH